MIIDIASEYFSRVDALKHGAIYRLIWVRAGQPL